MVRFFAQGGRFCAVAALGASALVGSAYANTLTVGPVEQVNLKNSTIVVLGQTYVVGSHATVLRSKSSSSSIVSLGSISAGELVSISGTETTTGSTQVSSVVVLPQQNVPGATVLQVTGIASSVDSVGQTHIGKLAVDITSTLTSDSVPVSAGALVSIVGTQPTSKATFVAQHIQSAGVGGTGSDGVGGTGSLGVGGTGSLGVGGTGSLGVGGTGSLGVGGTGSKGVGGTGSMGVGGTGSLGVGGTGSLGVGGTGSLGVGGTGSLGVGGTGSKGVGGTGSMGVGGTGSLGVGGTGSLGVGGTGSLGVGGTGSKGVGGTGSI